MIGIGVSPLKDEEIERYLRENRSRINITTDESEAYSGAEIVIIAVPTDFDEEKGQFDTDVAERAARSRGGPGSDERRAGLHDDASGAG